MRYFLDTEFLEGTQTNWIGKKTNPTIDLISIGIVSEDNREYYAISKDFNVKEAWNRFQLNDTMPDSLAFGKTKEYWIRENVLMPIHIELIELENEYLTKQRRMIGYSPRLNSKFTLKNFKRLIKKYGKSRIEMSIEIERFIYNPESVRPSGTEEEIDIYAYYADYDWVVFCWIFGNMMSLPKMFPMYCRDLKQYLDDKAAVYEDRFMNGTEDFKTRLSFIKNKDSYPKQEKEHNALDDAKWNKDLYSFIKSQL